MGDEFVALAWMRLDPSAVQQIIEDADAGGSDVLRDAVTWERR
jgi:hypothetical protein